MKVIVSLEQRFDRTPDGSVWATGVFSYRFWKRYLEVFDGVRVIARVRDVAEIPRDYQRSDGDGVEFLGVPYYIGPWGHLRAWKGIRHVATDALGYKDAVIMRIPSPIAACMHTDLQSRRQPYGVEVVGDPYDVFSPGAVRHPLRPLFRWLLPYQLRKQCWGAAGAAYVTQAALQKRYPCNGYSLGLSDVELPVQAFVTVYSSIELGGADYVQRPRVPGMRNQSVLICVGTLEQMYKGQDLLIEALNELVLGGLEVELSLVGDGKYRRSLEARCAELGLATRVSFRGQLATGEAVRTELDKADLFVLASRQEGLPRAMIEAMARGIPCVGTNVGGIPELLSPEDMVIPNDAHSLACKIREVVTDPSRLARMSAKNLKKAQEYSAEILQERRRAFYRFLKEQTNTWVGVIRRR